MTKDEFVQLEESHRESVLSLMKCLRKIGLSYSTYNYWKHKLHTLESDDSSVPFAQVSVCPSSPVVLSALISGPISLVRLARTYSNRWESLTRPYSGKRPAKSKGVCRETESEGSPRQTSVSIYTSWMWKGGFVEYIIIAPKKGCKGTLMSIISVTTGETIWTQSSMYLLGKWSQVSLYD